MVERQACRVTGGVPSQLCSDYVVIFFLSFRVPSFILENVLRSEMELTDVVSCEHCFFDFFPYSLPFFFFKTEFHV